MERNGMTIDVRIISVICEKLRDAPESLFIAKAVVRPAHMAAAATVNTQN